MNYELYIKIVTILVALSGWFKVFYDHLTSRPKISGRLMIVLRGKWAMPDYQEVSLFLAYGYLLNKRKNSVHILEYQLHVKKKGAWKWRELTRTYGMEKLQEFNLSADSGGEIKLKKLSENLIYRKNLPAQYGVPLHGWIPFAGSKELYNPTDLKFKLVCIDAYGNRHIVKAKDTDFVSLMLMMEITDMEFPRSMMSNRMK